MADYYSLLAKAVAGLTDPTPEARRAIYERAREALFRQLRKLDPPVPEEVIDREAQALEVAIAQLETEIAPRPASEGPGPGAAPEASVTAQAGLSPAKEPRAVAGAQPKPPPPEPANQGLFALPPAAAAPPPLPLKVRRDRKGQGATQAPVPGNGGGTAGGMMSARIGANAVPREALPLGPPSFGAPPADEAGARRASQSPAAPEPGASLLVEARRPFAPLSTQDAGGAKRVMTVGGIVGLVILTVAIAAYRLRDRPEDLVRLQASSLTSQGEASAGAKIADRVDAAAAPSQTQASSQAAPSPQADYSADAARPAAAPPVSAAPQAALLVAAPEEKSKVKTFVGTVVWRLDNVSGGPDEPLRDAVKAEIDIPEEKVQATVTIQKNFENTLPASHTVKVSFAVAPESPLGNIKQISGVQMRQEEMPTGEPLKGVAVPVVENSFLIGLAKGDAEAPNLELLRSRQWLDIPILLANGRIAKLTFEKGPSGQRVLDDAMASWRAQ
jgi:hypothetical protein